MKKRAFLKNTGLLVAGASCVPYISCNQRDPLSNWAGNITYSTANVSFPSSVQEVQALVAGHEKIRGLGSRHSFNLIADSRYRQISLQNLRKVTRIDSEGRRVTVQGGVRYGDICTEIDEEGLAFHNLASLPHISIPGACATATHGSGIQNGGLATAVSGLHIVTANGDKISIDARQDSNLLEAMVVSLGAFGIITEVQLDLQPTYTMKQVVYRNMPMSALENNFETIMSSGYSVSLFTDWKNKNINEVWIKQLSSNAPSTYESEFFGGSLAKNNLHPVETQSAESCTEQMGVEGQWYERLPHFKMGFTPSSGDELQAEYFVPLEHGYAAMAAVEKMTAMISPHLYISEIRTIAADNLWMSPCYKQDCVAIHFTFKPHQEAVDRIMPAVEKELARFNVRPHWGKLFAMSPETLQSRIQPLQLFKELVSEYDPNGKFRNDFLNQYVFS